MPCCDSVEVSKIMFNGTRPSGLKHWVMIKALLIKETHWCFMSDVNNASALKETEVFYMASIPLLQQISLFMCIVHEARYDTDEGKADHLVRVFLLSNFIQVYAQWIMKWAVSMLSTILNSFMSSCNTFWELIPSFHIHYKPRCKEKWSDILWDGLLSSLWQLVCIF